MKKQTLFLTLVIVVLTFFACKPPKEFIDSITVTPNPLEYRAGKVEVKLEGTFPEKYFTKKMEMTITPYLVSNIDGKITKAQPKTYQGEKVEDNNTTISYKVGGKYSQTAVFTYAPNMESSQLWLEITVLADSKEYSIEPVMVANGVNITPLLVSFQPGSGDVTALIAPDKFQRIIKDKKQAEINYLIQQSNIRSQELKRSEVEALASAIKQASTSENQKMVDLVISSYCSPDGGMDLNENLVKARSKSADDLYQKLFKQNKADVAIDNKLTAEDWEGFKNLLESSNIQDKDVILRVLNMYQDPEQRETEIRKLAAAYKTIADQILPELRRSTMTLTIDIIGKSDEEILKLANSDPKSLTEDEILYAATLVKTQQEKFDIYKKATEVYPSSSRAMNNLGATYFELNQLSDAGRCFAKALQMEPKNPTYNFNCGLIELSNGNITKAQEYLGNAGGVGEPLNQLNGCIAILNGDYSKAVSLFGNAKSNNAALANICNSNYTNAMNILNAVENPNAMTSYMKAIVCARTNDALGIYTNLKDAIKMDSNLKTSALRNVEFLSFLENEQIAGLLK